MIGEFDPDSLLWLASWRLNGAVVWSEDDTHPLVTLALFTAGAAGGGVVAIPPVGLSAETARRIGQELIRAANEAEADATRRLN